MGLKPLGRVKDIVEAAGMTISYVYEDLVFIDHNAFLLQFTERIGWCCFMSTGRLVAKNLQQLLPGSKKKAWPGI